MPLRNPSGQEVGRAEDRHPAGRRTEMVAAVGAGEELVGVSHECDHPPQAVAGRPVLTRARVGPLASSASVDRSVRQLVADVLAVYDIDVELLAALAPDVIVTQDLCRVCAVSVDGVRAAVIRLAAKADLRLVTLHPRRLGDILDDIARVGEAVGRPAAGARVVAALWERIQRVATVAGGSPGRPRVVTVEWIEPVLLGGLWMPELIELAGGEPLGVAAGEHAPTVGPDVLTRLAPEVVVVKPCGFTVGRTLAELPVLTRSLPWAAWTGPGAGRPGVCGRRQRLLQPLRPPHRGLAGAAGRPAAPGPLPRPGRAARRRCHADRPRPGGPVRHHNLTGGADGAVALGPARNHNGRRRCVPCRNTGATSSNAATKHPTRAGHPRAWRCRTASHPRHAQPRHAGDGRTGRPIEPGIVTV
jgi:iron complex transport system substrate-binding protein